MDSLLPSSHRLTSVSASQALKDERTIAQLKTGSETLDKFLNGGLHPGQIMEVYGPPGVGKTALGLELAARTILAGERVLWIDTKYPVHMPRLHNLLSLSQPTTERAHPLLSFIKHIKARTLAHLVSIILFPTSNLIPEKTGLIVLDNIATPFVAHYPPGNNIQWKPHRKPTKLSIKLGIKSHSKAIRKSKKRKYEEEVPDPQIESIRSKRIRVQEEMITSLEKIAASRGLRVLIINTMSNSSPDDENPIMIPTVNSNPWHNTITIRVMLLHARQWQFPETPVPLPPAGELRVLRIHKLPKKHHENHFICLRLNQQGKFSDVDIPDLNPPTEEAMARIMERMREGGSPASRKRERVVEGVMDDSDSEEGRLDGLDASSFEYEHEQPWDDMGLAQIISDEEMRRIRIERGEDPDAWVNDWVVEEKEMESFQQHGYPKRLLGKYEPYWARQSDQRQMDEGQEDQDPASPSGNEERKEKESPIPYTHPTSLVDCNPIKGIVIPSSQDQFDMAQEGEFSENKAGIKELEHEQVIDLQPPILEQEQYGQ